MYTKMQMYDHLFFHYSETAAAVVKKIGEHSAIEMLIGGVGEVYGSAWFLGQNRDDIKDKTLNFMKQKVDAKAHDPHGSLSALNHFG